MTSEYKLSKLIIKQMLFYYNYEDKLFAFEMINVLHKCNRLQDFIVTHDSNIYLDIPTILFNLI